MFLFSFLMVDGLVFCTTLEVHISNSPNSYYKGYMDMHEGYMYVWTNWVHVHTAELQV